MEEERVYATDVDSAREHILFAIIRDYRDRKIIYFNGWNGFGAAPVLRSMAKELRSIKAKRIPPELCFDAVIYIDCSAWESRRVMQRKIAEELKLGPEIMAMFDKQDEEDDFNGLDHGSRDVIPNVTQVIAETLWKREFFIIFLNGSDDEVHVNSSFGFPIDFCNHVIVWTFQRRSLTIHDRRHEIENKLRYTQLSIFIWKKVSELAHSEFLSLLREEAADIVTRHSWMQSIDLTMVTECCLYELFLQYSFHRISKFNWVSHAPNYWMCDGIIKGDGTRKINDTLQQEIRWVCDDALLLDRVFMEDPEAPFLVIKDDVSLFEKRPYRWICVTSKNLPIQEDTKTILERASSVFVALEKSDNPQGLPNGLLTHCSNLGVLVLYYCAFNFVSPPFLQCHGLRFLGLDHCTHDNTSKGDSYTNWGCLQSLWVLDLRYTEWDDILSEEKMDIMSNLRELNIEGVMCWQLTSKLHGRLCHLQKLRIIKPTHKAKAASMDHQNSLSDKKDMEILDLSGNREMETLPASLSMAKSLQMLILDGCDGLENVVVPEGSSLRSFSFDGYGPLPHWMPSFKVPLESSEQKLPIDADKRDFKTSTISLQGCTHLENLFVRGLPNLVELDLSGCAIKVLDFNTMVLNVPVLKRLFLLGCEKLRAIIWGAVGLLKLELVCIDTRSERAHGFTRPSLAQHKHFLLQLHAILADVRLARSLYPLVHHYAKEKGYENIYYKIHVTSPVEYGGSVQLERTAKKMIEPRKQQRGDVTVSRYGDVFSKIGDAPMLVFPQPPTQLLDCHIEISGGSHHSLESEPSSYTSLPGLMRYFTGSLHVHGDSIIDGMPRYYWWSRLRWCRMERCSTINTVFHSNVTPALETVWASCLQMARCIWNEGVHHFQRFASLKHLQVRSCPRLQFALPAWKDSFPSLESLHIIHCGDLTHVFVLDAGKVIHDVSFPKLATIHLHDLPKLQQISEFKMHAPALETIKIRGCFGLRRLPSLLGREAGVKRPTVEMEKDVWDVLQWDGVAAGHHPALFEPPVHSRYYRRKRLLRGTVLR